MMHRSRLVAFDKLTSRDWRGLGGCYAREGGGGTYAHEVLHLALGEALLESALLVAVETAEAGCVSLMEIGMEGGN